MQVERLSLGEWGDALPSSGFEVFHAPEALSVLENHAPGEMELYGGFKGQQLVAMLPTFVRRGPMGTKLVTSPPPSLSAPTLGPLLFPNSPKRKKQERNNQRFVEGVLDAVGGSSRTLVRVVGSPRYTDPRPFDWAGYDVRAAFTYRVSLDAPSVDDLMRSFSKSLRWEMGKLDEFDVTVERAGVGGARLVYRDVADRYDAQDEVFGLTWPYVRNLVTALDDRARVYVARDPAGEYLGGVVVLFSNDTAYYWVGGARDSYENVSVTNLVQRRILEDLMTDPPYDVDRYDLVGANTERICSYKAQFGGDLVPYYVVESAGLGMTMAKRGFELVNGRLPSKL